MPWSGSEHDSGLYRYFIENLDSMKAGIIDAKGLQNKRMLVFLSTSPTSSTLSEVIYDNGKCVDVPIKTYSGNSYTTTDDIAAILQDMRNAAPALNYALIVGCHGTGWTFKDDWDSFPYYAKIGPPVYDNQIFAAKPYGENPVYPRTRFFGSVSDIKNYAADITTLGEAITRSGMKMQYILLDDCYMANVESAYALRDATNFLVGSTSEILAMGMPYRSMWKSMASATPSYSGMTSAFHSFYSRYSTPCGTLAAIDCRETENLAAIMKEINKQYTFDETVRDSVQILGNFSPTIFYDMGSYVKWLCKDPELLDKFNAQLKKTVRSSSATPQIYSYLYGTPRFITLKTFSGITISDLSTHSVSLKGREKTAWWAASH